MQAQHTPSESRPTDSAHAALFKVNGVEPRAYRRCGNVERGAEFYVVTRRYHAYHVVYVDLTRDYLEFIGWHDTLGAALRQMGELS